MTFDSRPRESQIRSSDVYDDTLEPGESLEQVSSAEADLNAIRSQIRRWTGANRWTDGPGDARTIISLHTDLSKEEERRFFLGSCDATVEVGHIVSISGPGKQVSLLDVAQKTTFPAKGVVIALPAPGMALVQCYGIVKGIFTGLTPNANYFVGNDSRPSRTIPSPGGGRVFVQIVGSAIDSDELLLANNFTISDYGP